MQQIAVLSAVFAVVLTANLVSPFIVSISLQCKTMCFDTRRVSSRLCRNDNEMYQDFDFSDSTKSDFLIGLQKRADNLAKAEAMEMLYDKGDVVVNLPVICFDALLPGQRLQGSTTDPTFCEILRSIGLGGSFVMTSLNAKQRKLRRYATVAKIELVDVEADTEFEPTAVTFMIVGKRQCEILGAATGMTSRVGRWRRDYDPDGEETRLGWGEEKFVDIEDSRVTDDSNALLSESSSGVDKQLSNNKWNSNRILVVDQEQLDEDVSTITIDKATSLIPLIEEWYKLASNPGTYNNIDGVASTRLEKGAPGLRVNPEALLRKVKMDLGPMPPPTKPTAFALWGAALINPLPALGVSTEIRGAVLHVDGAEAKLEVLERGLLRSIKNLKGILPL